LDTAALTKAWGDFFEESEVFNIETLNKDGWLSLSQICDKAGIPRTTMIASLKKKGFEKKHFNIKCDGVVRSCGFYRPPQT
jgi:hypothetical protein